MPKLAKPFDATMRPATRPDRPAAQSFKPEDWPLFPGGWYSMIITKSFHGRNRANTGTAYRFVFETVNQRPKRVIDRVITETHEKEIYAVAGQQELADLILACGLTTIDATEELHGIVVKVQIVQKMDAGYTKSKNWVKAIRPAAFKTSAEPLIPPPKGWITHEKPPDDDVGFVLPEWCKGD